MNKPIEIKLSDTDLEFQCPFCGEKLELVAYKVDFEAWKPTTLQKAHEVNLKIHDDLELSWECKQCSMSCTNKHLKVSH